MGCGWNLFRFQLHRVLCVVLVLHLKINECLSLNLEGLALLEFRGKVEKDPYGAFLNWNPDDDNPCLWSGVHCVDGKVEMLNLQELSLGGTLAPELGELSHMRALVLHKNHFSGVIPKEIGKLNMLELLDLRSNNLSGIIPSEIGNMLSLKHLLLCHNKVRGGIPLELGKLDLLPIQGHDQNLFASVGMDCMSRKLGLRIWPTKLQHLKKANSLMTLLRKKLIHFLNLLPIFKISKGISHVQRKSFSQNLPSKEMPLTGATEPYIVQSVHRVVNSFRRRLLQETHNLPATAVPGSTAPEVSTSVPSGGSGSFPAVSSPTAKKSTTPKSSASPVDPPSHAPSTVPTSNLPAPTPSVSVAKSSTSSNNTPSVKKFTVIYVLPAVGFLFVIAAAMLFMCRSQGVSTIGPWKSGLSGQLQKAFVTGVPKLNRSELEASCEDFSNIVGSLPDCTLFKGTLSSGVEIAVTSTAALAKNWSRHSETYFRKKIDTLSRLNHKNFVNLLGYCEEEEPFVRMMVFEYAPNGTLFEHLHVKELEHLDWTARTRIIMGMTYCLQYMHHELNPPVAHPNLQSTSVYLTDDFAAKLADFSFWNESGNKRKISGDDDMDHSECPSTDPESNVYNFGILMLEIISGKLPFSEEQGYLVNWAVDYLTDRNSFSSMVDPMLKTFKNNELDVICEVIHDCIHPDPKERPKMKDVTNKLREVIAISPDAATPRLSPLWWAELEILSVEAS